jgi:hypothetical protein
MSPQSTNRLTTRFDQHPQLKARFEAILEVAENTQGDLISANEAEQRAIEPVRQWGNELRHDWAAQRITAAAKLVRYVVTDGMIRAE